MKTTRIDRFLGINNRLPDTSLSVKDVGRWLKDAQNVIIDNDGSIVRRDGETQIAAMTNGHSLFENFIVRGGSLYEITLPTYTQALAKVLSTNAKMSYAKVGETVFMSNGVDSLRTDTDGNVIPWGLAAPSAPTVSATSGGLTNGEYQVALSFSNAEEEGALSPATLASADIGGLLVQIPAGIAGATHVNVYVSGNSGNVPMLHSTVAVGTVSVSVTEKPTGREASRQIEAVLPAGTRVFEFNGRLCSVLGNTLYYSQPYRHGYYLPTENFVVLDGPVTIAVGNQGGVYVATDKKTHFLQGADIATMEFLRDILPYGAVPGTEFDHPFDTMVGWFGTKGIVVAGNDGEERELMAPNISLSSVHASGTSVVLSDATASNACYVVISCGWIINLKTGAAARYSGADYTSFSNGYGTTAAGIYTISDAGSVDAYAHLGNENFGVENEKFMPASYVGAESDAAIGLDVTAHGTTYSYQARSFSTSLNIHRIDCGRGLRSNYFGLKLTNPGGGKFKIASLSFAPAASSRRV